MILIKRYTVFLFVLSAILFLTGCKGCSKSGVRDASKSQNGTETFSRVPDSNHSLEKNIVKMEKKGGIYLIPIRVNGVELYFIFDTGASTISISMAEATVLYKQGKLKEEDILGTEQFIIADGSIQEGTAIILREVQMGNKRITNVQATVVHNLDAPLLLGQSALERFGKVYIDYQKNEITFE